MTAAIDKAIRICEQSNGTDVTLVQLEGFLWMEYSRGRFDTQRLREKARQRFVERVALLWNRLRAQAGRAGHKLDVGQVSLRLQALRALDGVGCFYCLHPLSIDNVALVFDVPPTGRYASLEHNPNKLTACCQACAERKASLSGMEFADLLTSLKICDGMARESVLDALTRGRALQATARKQKGTPEGPPPCG